ncbi:PAS domain S-box protein [Marinobacterium sp. MBR-109]|jgi:PAS domain S-box-containing protein|uniref:PAS domain S-box protein n=1 Tax=Marinobacterium sp. MBR-109 TaxID=3156462 RepID=UPI003392AA47
MWTTATPASLILRSLWLTLAYWLVSVLTLQLGFATEYALPIWPAAGVGVGMLLIYRRTAIVPIFIAALLTDLYLEFSLNSFLSAAPNALAATLQAYFGYRLTRTLLRRSSTLVRDADIIRFLLLAGPLACLTAPSLGVLTRLATGQLELDRAFSEWLTWWSGDTLGVLLFAPLTLLVLGRRHAHEASHRIGAYRIALPLLGAALLLGGGHMLLSQMQTREAELNRQSSLDRFSQLYFVSIKEEFARLEALAQLLQARPNLTEQEFNQFAGWLGQDPALIALDWAPLIPAAERAQFEQQHKHRVVQPVGLLNPKVTYMSADDRNPYFPVLYSAPPTLGASVLGLDHSWDPQRRQAISDALETGQLQLSRARPLIRTGLQSILAFQPVLHSRQEGQPPVPLGVVVGIFDIELLFAPLTRQAANRNMAVRITDVTEPDRPQPLMDRTPPGSPVFRRELLETGGRSWQLDFTLLTPLRMSGDSGAERLYFLFSILAAMLASYTTLSMAERDLATQLTVRRRTRDLSRELNRRREAEAELRSSETRYRQLFESSPFAKLILQNGRPVDTNNAAVALLDADSRQALLNANVLERVKPQDKQQVELLLHQAAESFEPVRMGKVNCCTFKDQPFIAELTAVSCEFDGQPAVLCNLQDITARLKAEEEFERFFTVSLDLLCIADTKGYFRRINPAFKETLGWTEEELLSQPFTNLVHPDDLESTQAELNGLKSGKLALHFENRYRCRNGRYRWIEWRALPQPNGLIFASAHDTTERHETTEQLEQMNKLLNQQVQEIQRKNHAIQVKETELNTLLNNLLECVITIDCRGIIASANPAVENVFGYRPEELLGQNVSMLMPDPNRSQHDGYLARYMETREPHFIGTSREVMGQHKDGHLIPLELAVTEYQVNGQTMFAGTLHDISEQTAMIDALTHARDEAERANNAKSTFLATMSHEIRTPMNGVVGLIEVLENSQLNEQQTRLLGTIRESANSLLTLIDDILDFSKIEAGRLELESQPFNLVELIENLCSSLVPVAHQRDVDLSLFIDPDLPGWVLSDPVRLRQLLYNLIGNGIKFCSGREGIKGRVSVRVSFTDTDPLQLKVRVADNGIGISAEQQKLLFAPFTQAESSTTRRFGGTGLGLVICKHLVDLMSGGIRLISEPDVGTVFILGLSMHPAAAPEDEAPLPDLKGVRCLLVPSRDYNSDDLCRYLEHSEADVVLLQQISDAPTQIEQTGKPCILISDQPPSASVPLPEQVHYLQLAHGLRRRGRITAPTTVSLDMDALSRAEFINAVAVAAGKASPSTMPSSADNPPGSPEALSIGDARAEGKLILVAEDDRVNQLVILQQLSLLGYTAEVADDGIKALELWQKGHYALLLTDLHMPRMDGYSLAAAIREQEPANQHMPIIALTANALRGESSRALDQGMDAYLVKPVKLEQLKQTLEQWLRSTPAAFRADETASDATPVSNGTEALNLDILRELVGADPALLREFLTIWQSSSAPLIEELRQAFEAQDTGTMSSVAHRFKSSSRSIGALPLGDLCADMEMACRAHDHDEISHLMQRFEQLYSETDAAVSNALDHL